MHNDHCFARIVLDTVVGIDTPWKEKIKSPAYKNMSKSQLEKSIELGFKILDGAVNLVELNKKSLSLRGRGESGKTNTIEKEKPVGAEVEKIKMEDEDEPEVIKVIEVKKRKRAGEPKSDDIDAKNRKIKDEDNTEEDTQIVDVKKSKFSFETPPLDREPITGEISKYFGGTFMYTTPAPSEDLAPYLKRIALCHKTPFQKKVLTALCQVPKGKFTTYAALSKHLKACPRSVGTALRDNPFAPEVPCHRVIATAGGIGGFRGSWGRNGEAGKNDDKKRALLKEEGVRFDGSGKVVGVVWDNFT